LASPVARLRPAIRRYDWGSRRIIADLLRITDPQTIAEAWFGAHPLAPATVIGEADEVPLTDWLGDTELPYLLKILSASRPLSIQVHPNAVQARAGFAREEAAGIPRGARQRSYRDASPKPELILALTPFHALVGLRELHEVVSLLRSLPELERVLSPPTGGAAALRTWLGRWLEAPGEARAAALRGIGARLHTLAIPAANRVLFERLVQERADAHADPGLLFILVMRLLVLMPGQALFLPAGCVHAYVEGTGLELMACSDNVVRAGLTSKHIDVGEFLRLVDLSQPTIEIAMGRSVLGDRVRVFETPASQFELCILRVESVPLMWASSGHDTLLNIGANPVQVGVGGVILPLVPGQACVLPRDTSIELWSEQPTEVFRVSAPSDWSAHASALRSVADPTPDGR